MRLKQILLSIIIVASLGVHAYAADTQDAAEKRYSVTGEVVQISKNLITVFAKEKEREFSLKGAEIRCYSEIALKDIVKIVYVAKDKKSAVEVRMIKPSKTGLPIYLTFDDGPDAKNTMSVIKTLKKYEAGATFFFTGKNMLANKETVKSAYDNGFAIGLHGYDHTSFIKMSVSGLKNDISRTNDILYDITGKYSKLTRPPYGHMNQSSTNTLASLGQKSCMWTIDTRDWEKRNASKVLSYIKSCKLKQNDVILMHSGGGQPWSAQVLPEIIEHIRSQGFEPVNMPF